MANFAVTLIRGPGWDETRDIREQDDWDAHAAFMDALVDDDVILFGAPVGDRRQTLHLVEARNEDAVRRAFGTDPWAHADRLLIGLILPWDLWLDPRA